MATFTAVVPTSGAKVDLTISGSVTVDATKFQVVSNGVVMELTAATGSGTTWSLPLTQRSGWIPAGQTVKVSSFGNTGIDDETVTATNNSIYTQGQQRYVEREFGIFVHLVGATWLASTNCNIPLTAPDVAAMEMDDYDMEQWFTSVIVPSGARYAVFTAKHLQGLSFWPTAEDNWNFITQSAFGIANPGADLVRDWVRLCRKYNIGVGLYFCVADLWWLNDGPGVIGNYANPAFIPYTEGQLTELMSNYGKLDLIWFDTLGYQVSYTDMPWSNLTALRDALQPDCLLVSNNHEGDLANSDIAEFEGSSGPGSIPASSNTVPSEFCEDSRTDDSWVWSAGNQDSYKNVFTIAGRVLQCRIARTAYLLNFPPSKFGLMPDSSGTYVTSLAAMLGKRGANPVLPSLPNVRASIDRGDGQTGSFGGGVNGSMILGMV